MEDQEVRALKLFASGVMRSIPDMPGFAPYISGMLLMRDNRPARGPGKPVAIATGGIRSGRILAELLDYTRVFALSEGMHLAIATLPLVTASLS